MRVCGIDPDTKSLTIFIIDDNPVNGPVALQERGWVKLRIEASGRRAEDRFLGLVDDMQSILPGSLLSKSEYVYIERPFVGPNRKAAIDVGMVVGALRGELRRLGVPHSLVDPAIWKKAELGSGHASKEDIKFWASVRFDLPNNLIQDVYDAATIAAFGLDRLRR